MLKKNNDLLKKIFYNYLKYPNKVIISENNKSLTWKELPRHSSGTREKTPRTLTYLPSMCSEIIRMLTIIKEVLNKAYQKTLLRDGMTLRTKVSWSIRRSYSKLLQAADTEFYLLHLKSSKSYKTSN